VAIDRPEERAIVEVFVDDISCGTGVVVADGIVVTCAHVVVRVNEAPKSAAKRKIQIQFLEDLTSQSDAGSTSAQNQRIGVELDLEHFSPFLQDDIAILKWNRGSRPNLQVAYLSSVVSSDARACYTKGFARLKDFSGDPVEFRLVGQASRRPNAAGEVHAQPVWKLGEANGLLVGHSGGPIFDRYSYVTLGLVARIGDMDMNTGHGSENAWGVRSATIRALWPELFNENEQSTEVLKTAREQLRAFMVDCLLASPNAFEAISKQFRQPRTAKSTNETCERLVDHLLKQRPQDCVAGLARVDGQIRRMVVPDRQALDCISRFYYAIAPAIVSERNADQVKLLYENIQDVSAGPLVVPYSDKTVLELFLAAIDGRQLRLERSQPVHVMDELAESGFQTPDGQFTDLVAHLCHCLNLKPLNLSSDKYQDTEEWNRKQFEQINLILSGAHLAGATKAIVLNSAITPEQEQRFRSYIRHMAIVRLTDDSTDHLELINPFLLDGYFQPPTDGKPAT
jgi:hypothetical protein